MVSAYLADKRKFVGEKYWHWTVIDTYDTKNVLAQCDCGSDPRPMNLSVLRRGDSKRCKECRGENKKIHGMRHTHLYSVWSGMKQRCSLKNCKSYKDYGGRGILVCDEWQNGFVAFMEWSMKNGYKEGLQIDRIDNNGNYCPENCRWVTRTTNQRNKSNNHKVEINGQLVRVEDVMDESVISRKLFVRRLQKGWPLEDAVLPKFGNGYRRRSLTRININGKEYMSKEISEITGLTSATIINRYKKRMNPEDIFAPIYLSCLSKEKTEEKNKRIKDAYDMLMKKGDNYGGKSNEHLSEDCQNQKNG